MSRPQPPEDLLEGLPIRACVPAPDLADWLMATFIAEGAPLENEDHIHLREARIGCLWCAVPNRRQMLAVAGTAEIPMARGGAWAKARHDQQLEEWFGDVPDFLLTFDPTYTAQADDAAFCALVEHELYHCGQNRDAFGAPKFRQDGSPSFGIRGHDVEEFVGVVARYGAHASAGRTADLIAAANAGPTIAAVDVRRVCGTCG